MCQPRISLQYCNDMQRKLAHKTQIYICAVVYILVSYSLISLQSIPPTDSDLEAVVREDSAEVMRETCPPELTSVDEKDVSVHPLTCYR